MTRANRPWSRAEKSLMLVPTLGLLIPLGIAWRQWAAPKWITFPGARWVGHLQFSPDGKRLALDGESHFMVGHVFDVATGAEVAILPSPLIPGVPDEDFIFDRYWSPDGRTLVAGYVEGFTSDGKISPGKIAMWDSREGRLLYRQTYAPGDKYSTPHISFSKDGLRLLGAGQPPAIFDARSGRRLRRISASFSPISNASFNATGSLVALSGRRGCKFEVRDVATGKMVWKANSVRIYDFGWSRNGVLGCSAETDISNMLTRSGRIWLWDSATHRLLKSPTIWQFESFALNDEAPLIAIEEIHRSQTINYPSPIKVANLVIWNYRKEQMVWNRRFRNQFSVDWSPDGRKLAVNETLAISQGQRDPNQSRLWIFDAEGHVEYERTKRLVSSVKWSPDSQLLAVAEDKGVEILRIDNVR